MNAAGRRLELRLVIEDASSLHDYERVPIAFEVTQRVVAAPIGPAGAGGHSLSPRAVERPFVKDYDALPNQRPSEWARRWDLRKWWFSAAYAGEHRVGGVAVVMDTGEVGGARAVAWAGEDVALLWDIRVRPDRRRQGVGRRLLEFAEAHARSVGRRRMAVETQDINVAACRFYARAGYAIVEIDPSAYPEFPQETQLIWRKELA